MEDKWDVKLAMSLDTIKEPAHNRITKIYSKLLKKGKEVDLESIKWRVLMKKCSKIQEVSGANEQTDGQGRGC